MMVSDSKPKSMLLSELLPQQTLPCSLAQILVGGITLDSRQVKPGYVFVAIKGTQIHGKIFIAQAKAKGAIAVLIDAKEWFDDTTIPMIPVKNLASSLSAIAGNFYGQPSRFMEVAGVTGTNGKTTCTNLLAQAGSLIGKKSGILGTMGYGLLRDIHGQFTSTLQQTGMTTPDAIQTQKICAQMLNEGCEFLSLEVSSHALAQERVADLSINTAIFTNLTRDHLDYHGSMAAYGQTKLKLFSMPLLTLAVVNQDDPFARRIIEHLNDQCTLITYSLENTHSIFSRADVHFALKNISLSERGMEAKLLSPEGTFSFTTQLIGRFNLSNLLAVVASLYGRQVSISLIVDCLPKLKPVCGRMELISNRLGFQVVVDYAHTPDALKSALLALKPHVQGNLWCVFGCGGDRDRGKRPEMTKIVEQCADQMVVTTDNPRAEPIAQIFSDMGVGVQARTKRIIDRDKAIEYAIMFAKPGDVILIAGKGHENYQLIGDRKIPFSDQKQARLFLRRREQGGSRA